MHPYTKFPLFASVISIIQHIHPYTQFVGKISLQIHLNIHTQFVGKISLQIHLDWRMDKTLRWYMLGPRLLLLCLVWFDKGYVIYKKMIYWSTIRVVLAMEFFPKQGLLRISIIFLPYHSSWYWNAIECKIGRHNIMMQVLLDKRRIHPRFSKNVSSLFPRIQKFFNFCGSIFPYFCFFLFNIRLETMTHAKTSTINQQKTQITVFY